MVGQRLVQVVAQVPVVGQVHCGRLHKVPLRRNALKEGDEVQLEEDHRVDRGSSPFLAPVSHQLTNERQVDTALEPAIEVVGGNQRLQIRLREQLEPLGTMAHHLPLLATIC